MKTCYTAIFGQYDELKDPFIVSEGWRYICYTDQDFKSDIWEVRKVPVMACGDQKTARFYKINFHEAVEDTYSIWVDGTFFINVDLNQWWNQFIPPFTTVKHPFDNCVYKEISACQRGNKAPFSRLKAQKDNYLSQGVPYHGGLIASGILMRKKTPRVIEFCKLWWEEVLKYTGRDQIAFAFADYKIPRLHVPINWDYTTQDEFIHIPHLTKKWRSGRYNEVIRKYGSNQR